MIFLQLSALSMPLHAVPTLLGLYEIAYVLGCNDVQVTDRTKATVGDWLASVVDICWLHRTERERDFDNIICFLKFLWLSFQYFQFSPSFFSFAILASHFVYLVKIYIPISYLY